MTLLAGGCSTDAKKGEQVDASAESRLAFSADQKVLTFSIESPPPVEVPDGLPKGGAIPPGLESDDSVEVPGDVEGLVSALLRCGQSNLLVNTSVTHVEFVSVPAERDAAANTQLVKCVQSRVPFYFSAGIGEVDNPSPDSKPFEALHAANR
jgi:hypothetical protein